MWRIHKIWMPQVCHKHIPSSRTEYRSQESVTLTAFHRNCTGLIEWLELVLWFSSTFLIPCFSFSMFLFIISLLTLLLHWDIACLVFFTSFLILKPKRVSLTLLILHPLLLNALILKLLLHVPIFAAVSQASSAICSTICLILYVWTVPGSTGANNHRLQKCNLLQVRYWLTPATCHISLVLDDVSHNTY